MPTFPAKINYAAGNVLTAAQMVDIGNGLNDLLPDAKGSLTTVSAANTPAQVTAGNNGETLVADSSTSTGLRYTPANAVGNSVINSAMQVWQRGTSIAGGGGVYSADRWYSYRGSLVSGLTISRQTTSDTTNLPFVQYCARVQRDSGNTGTQVIYFGQNYETINSIAYAGKTVTISFYARAGANYSSASNALLVALKTGTGTDQNGVIGNYTGSATVIDTNVTLTTTWQRFTVTGTLAATANELCFFFYYTPSGTAGANDYFEITGAQLDLGSVALPFRTYAATLAGELAACQRYFQIFAANDVYGSSYNTTDAYFEGRLPVVMRTGTQTVTLPATGSLDGYWATGGKTSATAPTAWKTTNAAVSFVSRGYTGLTANDFMAWTGGNITISAEL